MLFEKETYSHKVALIIKRMIADGKLQGGESVKESLLAEQLGLSRAPIREALQELTYEGILTSEPQKGKRVRQLSAKDIIDSYAVGGILEATGISESLDLWTEEDQQALDEIVRNMQEKSKNAKDIADLMDLDDLFHQTLLRRCNNTLLVELARQSCSNISKVLCYQKWHLLFSPQGFCQRHAVIAHMMTKKEAASLQKQIRAHYQEIGERIIIHNEN